MLRRCWVLAGLCLKPGAGGGNSGGSLLSPPLGPQLHLPPPRTSEQGGCAGSDGNRSERGTEDLHPPSSYCSLGGARAICSRFGHAPAIFGCDAVCCSASPLSLPLVLHLP